MTMASLQEHCADCRRELGDDYRHVHIWLDALFKALGPKHRSVRHHAGGVEKVRKLWGDRAARAAEIHIRRDCGGVVPSESNAQIASLFGSQDAAVRQPAVDRLECLPALYGSPDSDACVALRNTVLRKPLGLVLTAAQRSAEHGDHHLAGFRDGRLVGCLVLTPEAGGKVRMRQVAVALDCQRQGIGSALVQYAERYAAEQAYSEITAPARQTAVRFYRKLGYEVLGAEFIEVGIPHSAMRKALPVTVRTRRRRTADLNLVTTACRTLGIGALPLAGAVALRLGLRAGCGSCVRVCRRP